MMRANQIRTRLDAGQVVVNGWLSIGSGYSAEGVGHSGVHSVTVDLQHGMLDFADALPMIQAIMRSRSFAQMIKRGFSISNSF